MGKHCSPLTISHWRTQLKSIPIKTMTKKYIISGIVQGIGFRPNVKRIAEKQGVGGYIKNLGGSVEIVAKGDSLEAFEKEIRNIQGALITSFTSYDTDGDFDTFIIEESDKEIKQIPMLTPDIAVCDRCVEEFYNKTNRRYMHPFISCTYCGPRYSIQEAVPYDRQNITMRDFSVCDACDSEYRDIKDIRCHAQTIACNSCGPRLSFTVKGEPLTMAVKTLLSGGVVAIKDIGGYHFACLAKNEQAAKKLRKIKHRDNKPFAVMFNGAEDIKEYAQFDETEYKALISAARPIVLLKKKNDLAPSVCGESDYIGAFLPCNTVQHYLTKKCGPLVMTSANISGAPIITANEDITALRDRVGGFEILSHQRRILTPLDDSVCHEICGKIQVVRRGRGLAPMPIDIDVNSKGAVLALGGDLKASFCYGTGKRAYMSQYFGDLENGDAYKLWLNNIKRIGDLLGVRADTVIGDKHPLYESTKMGADIKIQHHFAHIASVIAEHNIKGNVLGFAFDGTGYGEDGNIWGSEAILYDGEFHRHASLEYTPLLGGDGGSKDAALTLDCYLISAGLKPLSNNGSLIKSAIKNNINTVNSSSMGRLFDAVSALLGICSYNSYEGECAIKLENRARKAEKAYPLKLEMKDNKWLTSKLICDIYKEKEKGEDTDEIALGFHFAVSNAITEYAKNQDEKNIALSGGVFTNKILTKKCVDDLTECGYKVYINEKVPTNDGGIALGQVWYALKEK